MVWLNELLGVEAPAGTTLKSAELVFRGPFSLWLGLVLFVVLAAGVFALYWIERGRIGPVRRSLMALLRCALILLLLLLIFRPLLLSEFEGQRPRPIALMLDNSQSMKQQDRRLSSADKLRVALARGLLPPSTKMPKSDEPVSIPPKTPKDPARGDLVRDVLGNPKLALLDRLRKHGPVRPYLFGEDVRGALKESLDKVEGSKAVAQLLAGYNLQEQRTALADAINELLQRKDGQVPAAVVIMTDGLDNSSKLTLEEVASECARLKVPLHIYGVGSSEGGSLQIKDLAVADTLFYDDVVTVPLRWRSRGFKKGTVEITLTLGGKPVAKREVPVREGDDLREELTFLPPKGKEREEWLDLVAQIRLKENPAFSDTLARPVRLIDSKVKVLYVENTPRWEYKFLQPALLRDRRVEAKFLLVAADPETLRPPGSLSPEQKAKWPYVEKFPTREKLLEYDLVILGDVPAGRKDLLTRAQMENLREFVEEFRGGLIVISGRNHMPAAYRDTPLYEVLPVEFLPTKFQADVERRTQPFAPQLTDAGKLADFLALADDPKESLRLWQELPGFHWHYPVTKLRPGATTLLEHPTVKAGEQLMPLAVTHYFGRGEVLFLASDETWRWRWNSQDRYFGRFWGQVIYRMGLPHLLGKSSSRAQLALDRSEAILNRQGQLFARLLDRDFRPLKDKEVVAELHALDPRPGRERVTPIKLTRVEGREGEYSYLLTHDAPGRFEIKLTAPEPTTFAYRVNLQPRHELEESSMAEEALREAARVSGGRFYREEDLYRLPDEVRPSQESFTLRQEVVLWNWLTFLLFLVLITVEWVVRKFSNLS